MENLSRNLRKLRKESHLTQDALAEIVGVSNSAISKWELGTSLPDTSILPSLAKALNTDLNSLFSFKEKLSKDHISQLTNNVKKCLISKVYDSAVKLVNEYSIEYPKDEYLLLNINSQLILLAGYDEPEFSDYTDRINSSIIPLEKLLDSSDVSIINQSKFLLSQAYSSLNNINKSKEMLIELAKSSLDTDIPLLGLLLKEDPELEFIDSSSIMLWQSINKAISILNMTSTYFKDKPQEALKYIDLSIDLMNIFNTSINFAYYSKSKLLYNISEFEKSAESFKDFAISITTFPINHSTSHLFKNVKLSLDDNDQEKNRHNLIKIYLKEDFQKLENIKDYNDAVQILKDYI